MSSNSDVSSQPFKDAIYQARLKTARAHRHVLEVEDIMRRYVSSKDCRIVQETEPETGAQLFSVNADLIPSDLPCAIGDTLHNLNSALDYLASGIMHETIGTTGRTQFPMHKTRNSLKESFKGARDKKKAGANRQIVEACPRFALLLLCKIKPYFGGDRSIWEIRRLANTDKHRLIVPAIYVVGLHDVHISDDNNNRVEMGRVQLSPGGVGKIVRMGATAKIERFGNADLSIKFPDNYELFAGCDLIPTLTSFVQTVTEVVDLCEASLAPLFQVEGLLNE